MIRGIRFFLLLGALAALQAAVAVPASSADVTGNSPGASRASAIEVCMPPGEQAYLSRLACSNGEAPVYQRVGSMGPRTEGRPADSEADQTLHDLLSGAPLKPGQVDRHILDGYEVQCGATKVLLYFDMYHCHQEPTSAPPAGFTFR